MQLNRICRSNDVAMFVTDSYGFFGYYFVDAGHHSFLKREERAAIDFVSLESSLSVPWKSLLSRRGAAPEFFYALQACHTFEATQGKWPTLSDLSAVTGLLSQRLTKEGIATDCVRSVVLRCPLFVITLSSLCISPALSHYLPSRLSTPTPKSV